VSPAFTVSEDHTRLKEDGVCFPSFEGIVSLLRLRDVFRVRSCCNYGTCQLGYSYCSESNRSSNLVCKSFNLDCLPDLCSPNVGDMNIYRGSCLLETVSCNLDNVSPLHFTDRLQIEWLQILRIDPNIAA
jgi:hypothetical protein